MKLCYKLTEPIKSYVIVKKLQDIPKGVLVVSRERATSLIILCGVLLDEFCKAPDIQLEVELFTFKKS